MAVFLYFFHILIVSYLLVQIQVEDDGAEDVTSVAAHIKALQDEMRKTIPNMTLLDDRMLVCLMLNGTSAPVGPLVPR